MIGLNNISKKIGSRILFDEVSASFSQGNRYGLTGPNGAGKSTLLKIMMGVEEATSGEVALPKNVGFLKQNIDVFADQRILDVVLQGNEKLWSTMQERDALYDVEMTDAVGMRLGDLEEVIADLDGYSAESDAQILLTGMGIAEELHDLEMNSQPTDTQFKVLLCQALFGKPDALLLDEPTNHLDLDSISWLEQFLLNYPGILIVVSHDRHFLNTVTTHIADIDYDTIIIYPGNYDMMSETKSEIRGRHLQEIKNKEKKISQLKDFVSKFGAGTRASQVQSRVREIDRLQPQEMAKSNITRPYIRFQEPTTQTGHFVYKLKNLSKSFDGEQVIKNFSLEIMRGDKIAIIGNNGRGKSTLIRMIAGVLKPDSGEVIEGHNLVANYFPQEHKDAIDKSINTTLFDWLKAKKPDTYDQDVRGVLGKLLFPGDDVFKSVPVLSGGETARMLLAWLMLVNQNTLILDEPNNHLDLESVSALGWGFNDYKGTIICAAHDRDLIDCYANKIIAFEDNGLHVFEGNLEEYLASRKK
ncbi:MAG: ABC-F family ATP-binding cassette domain-containing protein [Rhabdochlamydiaceae bacterium]|nr:ABC-F family ATP-binding cassette domain-containing protein [Candidatus Amphrikana amoebophyrae]